jgi:hypothetical protein
MNENKWSYLAGLFDGEGSVYIFLRDKENHFTTLSAAISNTSLTLMRWLIKNFGGRFSMSASKAQVGYKPQYKWEPKGKTNKKELLLGMLPHLVIKREQAILALEYLSIEGPDVEQKEKLRQKMCSLNKGSVETTRETPQPEDDDIVRTA